MRILIAAGSNDGEVEILVVASMTADFFLDDLDSVMYHNTIRFYESELLYYANL